MYWLRDPNVRLVMLSHLAHRAVTDADTLGESVSVEQNHITRLRELNAVDLMTLAEQPVLEMGVALELDRLDAALRHCALLRQARTLEAYFIRHRASTRLIRSLFRISRAAIHRRRRELGVAWSSGRPRLPSRSVRERVVRTWHSSGQSDLRLRYYSLHLSFPEYAMAVLEAVVRSEEDDR